MTGPSLLLRAIQAATHPDHATVTLIHHDDDGIQAVAWRPTLPINYINDIALNANHYDGHPEELFEAVAESIIRDTPWAASDQLLLAHARKQALTDLANKYGKEHAK